MKNIANNDFFANIGCKVHLNSNISPKMVFGGTGRLLISEFYNLYHPSPAKCLKRRHLRGVNWLKMSLNEDNSAVDHN